MSTPENLRNRKPNKQQETSNVKKDANVDDKLGLSAASAVAVLGVLLYFYIPHILLWAADDSDLWNPTLDPEVNLKKEKQYVPSEDHGPEYIHYPWVVGEVPRIKWEPDKPFAELFADLDSPVILYNTVADLWKARTRWTPEYITSKTPMLAKVQKHNDKTFSYFHDDHPMSGNADSLGEPYTDLYPIEPFIVKNESFKIEESYLNRWTNVWFGPAGATTHTHYDIVQNYYIQLSGKKRFVLFPPEQYNNLYLFPFLHPGAQQSQVRFEKPDYKNFPKFKNAKALDAVLNPGDVLYLPPLWFHHVSAITQSMSVSVWSKFNETQVMYKTVRSPLPFKKSWPERKLHLAGRTYLEILLSKLYGEVFEQRYNLLHKQFPELFQTEQSYCLEDMFPYTKEQILEESAEDFDAFSEELKGLFLKSKNEARRNIWLGNFCEQLGLTVAGIRNVGRFLLDFTRC